MDYLLADKAIRDLNKRNLRTFDRLKQLKFDELNILGSVREVYDTAVRIAKKRYISIAYWSYVYAMMEAGLSEKDAKKAADEDIVEDWIIEMLDEDNETTLYKFNTEIERKKARLVEALAVAHDKVAEIDKALRYLTQMLAQYADEAVLVGTIHGYADAGVKKVVWVSQKDGKVCKECKDRDGNIYLVTEIPGLVHFRCRCQLEIAE